MKLKTLAALAFMALASGCTVSQPVYAQEAACRLWQPLYEHAVANGGRLVELSADQRERFLAAYNAYPPKSDAKADRIFASHHEDHFDVALVQGECFTASLQDIPDAMFVEWLTGKVIPPGDPA